MDIDQSIKYESEVPLFWGKAGVAYGSRDFDSEQLLLTCSPKEIKDSYRVSNKAFFFLHLGRGAQKHPNL